MNMRLHETACFNFCTQPPPISCIPSEPAPYLVLEVAQLIWQAAAGVGGARRRPAVRTGIWMSKDWERCHAGASWRALGIGVRRTAHRHFQVGVVVVVVVVWAWAHPSSSSRRAAASGSSLEGARGGIAARGPVAGQGMRERRRPSVVAGRRRAQGSPDKASPGLKHLCEAFLDYKTSTHTWGEGLEGVC